MDETLRHHNPNPLLTANPISKLFFWWLNSTFTTGYKRRLEIEDLYNVEHQDCSEQLGNRLQIEWDKELKKRDTGGKPSLIRALARMFGFQYMLMGIIVFFEEGTKVVQPLLLGQLIRFFVPSSTVSERDAYLYAMGVSLCALVLAVTHHPYFFGVQRIGMQMRVACCSLLYRKSLRLSNKALGQTTTGQIVNLMSNDVNRFDTAAIFLHFLWVGPAQAIPVLYILWQELGPSTLAGFVVLLLLVPVQSWMGKLFSKLRRKTAIHTDERVKVMNEIITGMRVIKMYCWEKPFGELVRKLRRCEVKRVKSTSYVRGMIVGPFFVSTKLIVFLTFLSFILTGGQLTAEKVFVTIAMYQAIRLSTTLFIPFAVQFASETKVCCKRLQKSNSSKQDQIRRRCQARDSTDPRTIESDDREEIVQIKKTLYLSGVRDLIWYYGYKLFYFLFVIPYIFTSKDKFEVAATYTIIKCIEILQAMWLGFGFEAAEYLGYAYVSYGRVQNHKRGAEYQMIMKRYFLMTWNSQNEFLYNKPIFLTVFMMAIKTGHDIRPSQIFIANYAASLLGSIIGFKVMNAMLFNSEVMGVMPRILEFLLLDELEPVETLNHDLRPKLKDCVVKLDKVTAKWDKNLEQDTLQDISVEVGSDKLLAVIGPVGAGKSSLLMSILRELPVSEGGITVKGRIAYVAQQPWVFSASLRQNIVFGNKFERKKYDRILKACALTKDVTSMPDGDSTLIGDRGVSLSGGQRARVSLARALYMDADIYLLDDPLSAVDASVGRHLFENVVQGLLKSKPRILVTHQLQFLAEADELIILKEGVCLGKGTFVEMANSGIDFSSLLKTDKNDDEEETEMENPKSLLQRLESIPHSPGFRDVGSTFSLTSIGTEFEPEPVIQQPEEERKEGTVGIGIYAEYFKAGAGTFKFLLLVFLNLAAQTAFVMSDWWLAYWSNLEEDRAYKTRLDNSIRAMMESSLNYTSNVTLQTNVTIPYVDTNQYVYIFTGMIAAVFLFGLLRALMFFKVAVDASMNLHNRMFNRMLRSPIAFFDTNPVGRILNRFSKDTGHMDDILPITFFDFIQCFLLILGIIVVVCVVNPWVFIPLVPLCVLFYVVRKYYIQTSRHVKRLEGTTRSPVFSHLSASLQGLHTIRALSVQEKFVTEFDNHQNLHSEAWLMFLVTSRWLAVRLDWICVIFVTVVAMSCVIVRGSIDAGEVGLSLTYAMTLMGMFQWAVRQSTEVENQMISVERILDYSKMDTEGELLSDKGHQPPPDWPQHGKISADKASLKYAENGPRVLKQLTFCIKGEEKIGIVGRTGAGKSSLITMLFRMVEPSGSVKIDDVDIQKIGLHDLRNKISIIPQDPVLFTGSLRKNLDPFGNHDDKHLWSALEEVQMKSAIDDLPSGLESEVSEGGINFSVGQRQLICLARAILRKNKILMIDEATANVDLRTDQLIQETIREKFRQCTVLTIAHRLNTIMDSDKVMMLEEGNILEFDQPYTLLQNEEGHLYKMVQQIGKAEMEHLIEVAKNAFKPSVSSPPSSPVENHIAKNKASSVLPNHTQIICDTEKYPTGDDLDDDVFVHADEDSDPTDKVIGAKQPHEKFSGKKGDVNSSVTTNGAEKDSQAESGVFSPANDLEHFLSDMDSGNSPLLFSARDHIPNENKQGPLNSNSKHKDDSDLNSLMKKGTELTDHVKTGKLPSPSSSFSSEEEENAESSYLIPKDSKENGVTEDNVVNV